MKHSIPMFWRLKNQKYNLIGSKCDNCGEVFFPNRTICPNCRRNGKMRDITLSGLGKIESFTVINNPPKGFEEMYSYVVGIIKLNEGPMISAQIVNKKDEIAIGDKVRMIFRKISEDGNAGLISYGFKFELDDKE